VISWFEVVRHYGRRAGAAQPQPAAVSAIVPENPKTVSPETSVLEAITVMRQEKLDYLLVVKEQHLVGIVTERDILNITARLLEQQAQTAAP
jgi:CBS domain-containing protein